MELAEFVSARLDEDEAVARAAMDDYGTPSWAVGGGDEYVYPDPPPGNSYIAVGPWDGAIGCPAAHIARHDPARVLAQVEAHRRIVQIMVDQIALGSRPGAMWDNWRDMANQTLRALASIWSDHPDRDPAWEV